VATPVALPARAKPLRPVSKVEDAGDWQQNLLYPARRYAWSLLPKDFPPWSTTYRWFAQFRDDGIWERINHHLVMLDRERASL
jgi:hypothetical protein